MIASLMMYERPELVGEHARLWALIRDGLRAAGIDAPDNLSQMAEEMQVWTDPALVLSQTCGMPYRLWLRDRVTLVGTPDYGLTDCPHGYYRSALIVSADDPRTTLSDFRDATFAFNQTYSQSGFAAPYWHLRPLGFWFKRFLHTRQHRRSAQAVAEGIADIAALDAVSWRLMRRFDEYARDLRVLDWTQPTPGLPLITALRQDRRLIFDAVAEAIDDLPPADRDALGLRGLVEIAPDAYFEQPDPPRMDAPLQPTDPSPILRP